MFVCRSQMLDSLSKLLSEFLPLDVFTRTGMCFCNAAFVDAVNDFDSVRCLLFSIVVNTDIFSDAVEPTVKRSLPPERLDGETLLSMFLV